ncbi:pyridine nucleotide-disulfide oxidoreductase domain-containing protein 1 [Canis aureus]
MEAARPPSTAGRFVVVGGGIAVSPVLSRYRLRGGPCWTKFLRPLQLRLRRREEWTASLIGVRWCLVVLLVSLGEIEHGGFEESECDLRRFFQEA